MLSMNMKWLSSLMILAEIAVVKPQGFENGPGTVNGLVNGSMVFSWNFDRGPNNVSTIRWFKDDTIFVLGIIIGGDQRKGPEYTDRMISYIEPYGFELSYLTQGDAGKYTCEIFAGSTLTSDAYLEMFYLDLPLEVVMEIEGNSSSDTIEVDAKVKVTVWAPYNDPPVVNISIGVSYDLMTNSDINCDNMNGTIPCIHEWTANEASDVVIKSCLAHPAVSVKVCKEAKFTVTDGFTGNKSESEKGPDEPGAECKWWCILLIVLAVLAILGIIVGLMYHYRVACFRSKSSAQIDVNQKQETNGFGMENKAY